jgi:hypothetical protein
MAGGTGLIIEILFLLDEVRQQPRTQYQEHGPEKSKNDIDRGDLVPKENGVLMFDEKSSGDTENEECIEYRLKRLFHAVLPGEKDLCQSLPVHE